VDTLEPIFRCLRDKSFVLDYISRIKYFGKPVIKREKKIKNIYLQNVVDKKKYLTLAGPYTKELYKEVVDQSELYEALSKDLDMINMELKDYGVQEKPYNNNIFRNVEYSLNLIFEFVQSSLCYMGLDYSIKEIEDIIYTPRDKTIKVPLEKRRVFNTFLAYDFIFDVDITYTKPDYVFVSYLTTLLGEGIDTNSDKEREENIGILPNSHYVPPKPYAPNTEGIVNLIYRENKPPFERAVDLILYFARSKIFSKNNDVAALIAANSYLLKNCKCLILVKTIDMQEYKELLGKYFDDESKDVDVLEFFKKKCLVGYSETGNESFDGIELNY